MTEEIERMMTELTVLCNKGDSISTTRTPEPAGTTVFPKLLSKPETMQANSGYAGPNPTHLLLMPGDTIIAYAYISEVIAVGFNTRTNLGGRFPVNTAKRIGPQPHDKVKIFIAKNPHNVIHKDNPFPLSYNTDNMLECAVGKRIGVTPMALILVLLLWANLMSGMTSRKFSGLNKPKDFYRIRTRF